MSKLHPITRELFQWQTSTGAVAQEFFTEKAATEWMAQKINTAHRDFYSRLQLVKVETTIKETVVIPAANPN